MVMQVFATGGELSRAAALWFYRGFLRKVIFGRGNALGVIPSEPAINTDPHDERRLLRD